MRSGWQGNRDLQDFVQRLDSGAGLVAEVVTAEDEHVKREKSEWNAGSTVSGSFRALDSGGAQITPTTTTLIATPANDGANTTRLTKDPTFDAVLIRWLGSHAEDREFSTLVARLDPRADGGQPKTVSVWRAELYRVTQREGDQVRTTLIGFDEVDATGEVAADYTFSFARASGRFPVAGPPPEGGDGEGATRPETLLRIRALDADGGDADNVTWLSNAATGSQETGLDYSAFHFAMISASDPGARGGTTWDFGGLVENMPEFTLSRTSQAQAVIEFTGAEAVPDLPGNGDLVIVARGEEWADSAITYEIDDGDGYVACVDGDVIGEDKSAEGGSDLSGVDTTGPWDLRVTLTPSTGGLRSPIVREFGVERVERQLLAGIARVSGAQWVIPDPATCKANIPQATIEVIKSGERDYLDYGSLLLSKYHIGEIELRVWVGDPSGEYLPRSKWMLHSVYEIEDFQSHGLGHTIECLSPMRRARIPIPPFVPTTGNDGTRDAVEVSGTIAEAWSELVDSFIGFPARWVGQGPVGTASVTKRITEGDAKDELDRLAFLAGGANIESQGRIRFAHVMREEPGDTVVAHFPIGSYQPVSIGPGFRSRTDEYFIRYAFDDALGAFEEERRFVNATAFTKLGGFGLETTQRLDEQTCRWIASQSLADTVGFRQVRHFANGQILWEIHANERHPQLELGDVVAIETDLFVGRSPLTDTPIRGPVWAQAIVVQVRDFWGQGLRLWIPSFDWILPSGGTVTRDGFSKPPVPPTVDVSAIRGIGSGVDPVTVRVTVYDPQLRVTAIEYKLREGIDAGDTLDATWQSTWSDTAQNSGTPGTDEDLVRQHEFTVQGGLGGEFLWRVAWTDKDGTTRHIADSFTPQNLEEETKTVIVDHFAMVPSPETASDPLADPVYRETYLTHNATGARWFRATVQPLPVGATITAFRARAAQLEAPDAGGFVQVVLFLIDEDETVFGISGIETLWTSPPEGPTWKSDSTIGAVVGAEDTVYILVQMDHDAVDDARFYRAEITYAVPAYRMTI